MKNILTYHFVFKVSILVSSFSIIGCIEPFEVNTTAYENVLVIEATITNEFKQQQVSLGRSFSLTSETPGIEPNASVSIIEDEQTTYVFSESSPGQYTSNSKFKAKKGSNYQLKITTNSGKNYTSNPTQLTGISKIDSLYALKELDKVGMENITINVDSYDPTGNSKYYRFEYEETARFSPSKWNDSILVVNESGTRAYPVPKTDVISGRICYRSDTSKIIIQAQTIELSEDRLSKFSVRSLSNQNYMISNRYSIMVRQYVQSYEAYTYYKTITKFSGTENILAENQPGYFDGNVSSEDDPKELVVGYFDVSSVDSKRLFFNYDDFYPDTPLPPYFVQCEPFTIAENKGSDWATTVAYVQTSDPQYYGIGWFPSDNPNVLVPSYLYVPVECGDCRYLGTDIKPEFWIDK